MDISRIASNIASDDEKGDPLKAVKDMPWLKDTPEFKKSVKELSKEIDKQTDKLKQENRQAARVAEGDGNRLKKLTNPATIAKLYKAKDERGLAALCGVLGAVEKGGKAIGSDESAMQQAAHYWRVLTGRQKQQLGESDFKKIARLVKGFLQGPAQLS